MTSPIHYTTRDDTVSLKEIYDKHMQLIIIHIIYVSVCSGLMNDNINVLLPLPRQRRLNQLSLGQSV